MPQKKSACKEVGGREGERAGEEGTLCTPCNSRSSRERASHAHARYSHGFHRCLMVAADDIGPAVFPPFAPSLHRDELSSFLARASLCPNITELPPCVARDTSTACVGTHMSRIPTVSSLVGERERERERPSRHLVGETSRKDEGCTRLGPLIIHTRRTHASDAYRRMQSTPRALTCTPPFCRAFSANPPYINCPHDSSTDKCSFLFVTHAPAISALRQASRNHGAINRRIRWNVNKKFRSIVRRKSPGAMSRDNVAPR